MKTQIQNNHALWWGLATAIVLGSLWQFTPLEDASQRMDALPLKGLAYQGKDIPLLPFEKDFLEGVHAIKRVYDVDKKKFFVTVIDGTHNRHVIHDPYYCFSGSGWSILNTKEIPLKNGHALRIRLKQGEKTREAVFWFTNGLDQYTSPMRYWAQTTLRRLTLGLSGPEPILVVIQPAEVTGADWEKFFDSFQPLLML